MIEYNTEVTQLTSVFTQFRNSINIYTEDKDKDKQFYVKLIDRLLEGAGYKIKDVVPLGDCDTVIASCSQDNDPYPKLYITDGDINLMTSPKNPQRHLFILPRYCIENFVIDKEAFYSVFESLDYLHSREQIRALVDYDTMVDSIKDAFMSLFHYFAVSQNEQGVFILKDSSQFVNKKGEVDSTKISSEKEFVKQDVCNHTSLTEEQFTEKINVIENAYDKTLDNLMIYVSGKDYLLPFFVNYAQKKLGLSIGYKREGWKYQFAKYCDLNPLESLKDAIVAEIQSIQY